MKRKLPDISDLKIRKTTFVYRRIKTPDGAKPKPPPGPPPGFLLKNRELARSLVKLRRYMRSEEFKAKQRELMREHGYKPYYGPH
ncbi:hypothetical protein HKCCE2091_15700 [Rhodobacterales bacterium HKCCE2091]|nr:hypothetical protein [Rhodobacterales bacterium HKCCE2091]